VSNREPVGGRGIDSTHAERAGRGAVDHLRPAVGRARGARRGAGALRAAGDRQVGAARGGGAGGRARIRRAARHRIRGRVAAGLRGSAPAAASAARPDRGAARAAAPGVAHGVRPGRAGRRRARRPTADQPGRADAALGTDRGGEPGAVPGGRRALVRSAVAQCPDLRGAQARHGAGRAAAGHPRGLHAAGAFRPAGARSQGPVGGRRRGGAGAARGRSLGPGACADSGPGARKSARAARTPGGLGLRGSGRGAGARTCPSD
jgi:hypothetical protein